MNDAFLLPSFGGPPGHAHVQPRHYGSAAPSRYAPSSSPASSPASSPSSAPRGRKGEGQQRCEEPEHGTASARRRPSPDATRVSGGNPPPPSRPRRRSPTPAVAPDEVQSHSSALSSPASSRHAAGSADVPTWALNVLRSADGHQQCLPASPRDAVLSALDHIRAARVSPRVLAPGEDVPAIVSLVGDTAVLSHPNDRLAVIAALHVLASDAPCRDAVIASNGLESLAALVADASSSDDVGGAAGAPAVEQGSAAATPAPAPLTASLPRPLWDAAIRTIAKLVVFSPSACARAIETDALSALAAAALPGEPMDTRVRAAAGLAAVASWSGPRWAVHIVNTPNVTTSMAAVLTDPDERILPHLRRATLDGLTVMAHRRHARLILKQRGCDQFISAAARQASVSGDYDVAARSTVAAGHMTGHSLDEFGFLVENGGDDVDERGSGGGASDGKHGERSPRPHGGDGDGGRDVNVDSALQRQATGLALIQAEMLEADGPSPDDDVESLGAVVDHRAGGRSSPSPSSPRVTVSAEGRDVGRPGSQRRAPRNAPPPGDGRATPAAPTGADPEWDVAAGVSPLVGFTTATERAAARDAVSARQKKSETQRAEEAQHERVWENVLARRPRDLERENGEFGRVRAYRDLAGVPIPSRLRASVWPKLLDVDGLRRRKPALYEALCRHGEAALLPEDIEHTIEADLTRTMPYHCLFWRSGAAPGIGALRRVLRAYAFHVPAVGYCQGMSSIAALILLNSPTEEDAFLMLVRFLSRYGYKNVFKPGFPQYKEWVEEVRGVITARHPALHARFEREGVIPELFLDKGLITCLTHNYPHRALVRVWDLMLLGGSPKIVLKACLAVLVLSERRLMSMDFEGMVNFLQRGFADPETGVLRDGNVEAFLDLARSVKLTVEPSTAKDGGPAAANAPPAAAGRQQPPHRRRPPTGTRRRSALSACLPCLGRKED